jgi:ABC-type branched-subunit amino acid transport system substrate-binding protein
MSYRALPRPKTNRGRLRLLALPVVAVLVAGCGSSGSSTGTTVTASASTSTELAIYVSDPPAVQRDAALQDVVFGEELAFADLKKSLLGNAAIKETIVRGTVSDNARKAINNAGLLAYVGEIQKGESVQTVGITNAEDVLEISPTDTVVPVKTNFEDESTYGRTFASLPVDLTTSAAALQKAVPKFASAFEADFRRAPSADAIYGYDSMYVLLRVISHIGSANYDDRTAIVKDTIATLKANQGQADVSAFTIKK